MKEDQTRLLLAVVLSAMVLFVWQRYFGPKPHPVGPGSGDAGLVAEAPGDGGPQAVAALSAPPSPSAPIPAPAPAAAEEKVEFDSPTRHLVFSSYGGALRSAVLKGEQFKRKVGEVEEQVDLVQVRRSGDPAHPGPDALPLSLDLSKGLPALPMDLPYAVSKQPDGVTFTAQVGAITVTKQFHVPAGGYDLQLDVTLQNNAATAASGELVAKLDGFVAPGKEESGGFFGNRGPTEARLPIARINEKTDRRAADKDKGPETQLGPVSFIGLDERYFLTAMYPTSEKAGSVTLSSAADGMRLAEMAFPTTIPPGGSVHRTLGVFLGPKLQETLHEAGQSLPALKTANPELESAVDYGFVAVISTLLLKLMRFFHGTIPNWGVAIILLTLSVKAVLFPLTNKQMASMESMRRLQPQIEALKSKFPDDKERQNLEMMKLYQENKVNPLGGCLPMLVQMPVWWGLYRTLEYAFDLYRQPFIHGWINDLSVMDPTYILPVCMGASMFLTQKMQPQMGDATQQKMMLYFMPVFFTFIMKSLPSGLNLYILCNNLLSIAQQTYLRRRYPGATPPRKPQVVPAKG